MTLQFFSEFQIRTTVSKEIGSLLHACFPDVDHSHYDHYKQQPHFRILVRKNNQLVGHLGIDHRMMNLNGVPIQVFGVIALAVHPNFRKQGIAKTLLQEFESIAKKNSDKIDFLFLVTDKPKFYLAHGYLKTSIETSWLKIHEYRTLGVGSEKITDTTFMFKPISGKTWKDGALDMLGYMY